MPNCKKCNNEFTITDEDKKFYVRIEVPDPTWCPPCREMRRMSWCNEGVLYPGKCDLCGKSVITQFSPGNPRKVYCLNCWHSDKWDPLEYAKEIDWSRSFFEQMNELDLVAPHSCVSSDSRSINSDYTHHAGLDKNCYMIFHADYNEDCYYGYGVKKSKDCVDIHNCFKSELCYQCIDVHDCYHLAWSQDCIKCANSYFLRDCVGCSDCFLCVGLRQKKNYFLNQQLTQEEYENKLKELNTGSNKQIQDWEQQYLALQKKHTWRYAQNYKTQNSSGNYLHHTFDSHFCFDCSEIEKSKYCSQLSLKSKDCYDIYQYGLNLELCYDSAMVGQDAFNILFSYVCTEKVRNLSYCNVCYSSSDCFACVSLKKKQFCILNKQYREEEYFKLKDKIIAQMKENGEYGEFFPIKYSQFGYNETMAQLWFPLTKEQVLAKGWNWQDNLPGTYDQETIKETPDDIKDVDDNITKEVLACEKCKKNYKIILQELDFYKRNNYPLPRQCFDCRRLARMKLRNPRKFWQRKCDSCGKDIETTYSPDRPETVYCEECYRNEIY